jgi:hypothetical protein
VFALFSALWLALSFGSHDSFVYSNLSWWIGGTAIFCLFVAGLIAGISSGARGVGAGTMGGLTTWALVMVGVGAVVLPTFGIGHIPNTVTAGGHVYSINYLTYWTAFWSVLIGLGAALLGGITGGSVNRRVDEPYLDLQSLSASTYPSPPSPVGAPAVSAPVVATAPVSAVPTVPAPPPGAPVATEAAPTVVYERP